MLSFGMVWYGTAPGGYGMVQYGVVRYDMRYYGTVLTVNDTSVGAERDDGLLSRIVAAAAEVGVFRQLTPPRHFSDNFHLLQTKPQHQQSASISVS